MGLKTPEKIGKLQRTLYAKAKEQPERRFHQLYDKVWREDVLEFAYRKCKAKGGAAWVDRESFQDIETYGREKWLGELAAAKPIGRWTATPDGGFASGCGENTRSEPARERGSSRTTTCTNSWDWYD